MLLDAYSDENLHKIALTLLDLYKEQEFSMLNKVAEMIGEYITIEITPTGKGFSKLMMLYHPDKGDFHRNTIIELALKGDYDELLNYSHILKLIRIDEIAGLLDAYEDIDYSPVYEWDWENKTESFNIITDEKPREKERPQKQKFYSFYDAFKIRIYGHTKKEIPYYYFEDLEEIEMTESSLNSLDGIEFCKHALVINLSGNQICDLSDLWNLPDIKELNLADNKIQLIDELSNLVNLRELDISNNRISDLSPLYQLTKLETITLTGNPVPPRQIKELEDLGITIYNDKT